jgi:hypothetical protein
MSLLPNSSKTSKASKGVTLQNGKTRSVVMPNWGGFGPVYRGSSGSTGNAGNLSIALAGGLRFSGGASPNVPILSVIFFCGKGPKRGSRRAEPSARQCTA